MKSNLLPLLLASTAAVAAPLTAHAAVPLAAHPAHLLVTHAAAHAVARAPQVPRFAKFETYWTLPNQTGNPYDPSVNDITVEFNGPDTTRTVVPAFWDGDRWRVRFTPTRTGTYSLRVLRAGKDAKALGVFPRSFQCTASTLGGFVRASSTPAPCFVLDNGQPYYPLGMDVAWIGGTEPGYPDLLRLMADNGLNWARIWMNHWDGKNLDWAQNSAQQPPLGTLLLGPARTWDTILENADLDGVYVQMTLQHHGQYTAFVDPNWQDNPWNVANGGFLAQPQDFFTDPQARRLTKAKYRYIVARYGYSPHLLAFELFNEVQNITEVQAHFGDVVAWHQEMAAYIRSIDVNHHLITTSNSVPGTSLAQIGLDYDQIHTYPPDLVSYFAALRPNTSTPTFVGEWGYSGNGSLASKKSVLHDGIWASLTTPTAGAGQFWYGDAVVANNWWPELQSPAAFVKALQVAQIPAQATLAAAVSAPGPHADLSFAPPGGWGPTTRTAVTLPSDGSLPDLSGVSSYVQGNSHRDFLPRPIVFTVNITQPAAFRLDIGTVAAAGAHPVITLDGQVAQEQTFAPAASNHDVTQTLSISLPPGIHQVGVFNTGTDWFIANSITVTNYVPSVAVLARGTNSQAVFWAHVRPGSTDSVAGATVQFPGLAPGRYAVRLWDIAGSRPLPATRAQAVSDGLTVTLPAFTHDIAGVAVRQ